MEKNSRYFMYGGDKESRNNCKGTMGDMQREENNSDMDLRGIDCEDVDWIDLVQDKFQWKTSVNTMIKLQIPYQQEIFWLAE